MSASIVKKAMALFGGDHDGTQKKTGRKYLRYGNKSAFSLRKTRKRQKRNRIAKEKRDNNALENFKKKAKKDNTRENVQLLLQLSSGITSTVKKGELQEILSYQKGRLSKNNPIAPRQRKQEKTVFTEADFAKFEKEYIPKHKSVDII